MTSRSKYRSASRSRRLIRGALLELLCEKDIADITVTEVVARADLNRSTFYAHYSNLMDVLEELEDDWLALLCERLEANAPQAITPGMAAGHLLWLAQQLIDPQNRQLLSPALDQMLRRVASRFLQLCLQKASPVQLQQPFYQLHMRLAVEGTLTAVFAWLQGESCCACSFEALAQELTQCFDRL